MSLTALTTNLDIIAALDDEPNDISGLTSAEAKAKFDEGPNDIKNYINDTLIPELDAVHLPYDCTVEGGQTIKEALDEATLGTLPDSSITAAKLASSAYSTKAQAEAGTATTGIMNPLRVAEAISALGVHLAYGAYSGTGTYGTGNKNSAVVGFVPRLFALTGGSAGADLYASIYDRPYIPSAWSGNGYPVSLTWGTTMQWWNGTGAQYQFNENGYNYYWFAIG